MEGKNYMLNLLKKELSSCLLSIAHYYETIEELEKRTKDLRRAIKEIEEEKE